METRLWVQFKIKKKQNRNRKATIFIFTSILPNMTECKETNTHNSNAETIIESMTRRAQDSTKDTKVT